MKLAGIDGVIIDWYGPDEYWDYGQVHRNTQKLIVVLKKAGLHFAIMYEDQTVPHLIEGKQFSASEAVAHGQPGPGPEGPGYSEKGPPGLGFWLR